MWNLKTQNPTPGHKTSGEARESFHLSGENFKVQLCPFAFSPNPPHFPPSQYEVHPIVILPKV